MRGARSADSFRARALRNACSTNSCEILPIGRVGNATINVNGDVRLRRPLD